MQIHAKAFPYFTRFISGLKIKLHASSFNMVVPWAWTFGWGSAQDFTANSFSKELCVYFISPNSCFVASREEREGRAWMGEMILIPREALTRENRNWTERPRQTEIRSETVPTCDCGQKWEEEESGRNKTINMHSTLGNVSFLDNSELAKQTGPFMTMQNK